MNRERTEAWRKQINALPDDCIKRQFIQLFKTVTRLSLPQKEYQKTIYHHNASIQETIHASHVNFAECSVPPDDKT